MHYFKAIFGEFGKKSGLPGGLSGNGLLIIGKAGWVNDK